MRIIESSLTENDVVLVNLATQVDGSKVVDLDTVHYDKEQDVYEPLNDSIWLSKEDVETLVTALKGCLEHWE